VGPELLLAILTCLALAVDRTADKGASFVVWHIPGEKVEHVFGRQAIPMVWDFAHTNPLSEIGWFGAVEWIGKALEATAKAKLLEGQVQRASATAHPLPNDAGWRITASWPIDTEMAARLVAKRQSALASSVHLVCRPREDASGAVTESIGEWRNRGSAGQHASFIGV